MINRWDLGDHNFKTCISAVNTIGAEHQEYTLTMNIKILILKIEELNHLDLENNGSKTQMVRDPRNSGKMLMLKKQGREKMILLNKFGMNSMIFSTSMRT